MPSRRVPRRRRRASPDAGPVRPMITLVGTGASDGIAVGPARLLAPRPEVVDRWVVAARIDDEVSRLVAAAHAADRELAALADHLHGPRRETQLIIDAHRLMLQSDEILERAKRLIRGERLAAECAVRRTVDRVARVFDQMKDTYLRERGRDVEAVGDRLIDTLSGRPRLASTPGSCAPSVGVCGLLSPIDAFQLQRLGICGVATEQGGRTSHAAIIVQALGLPCVVGVPGLGRCVARGDVLIVDGTRGLVIANPDADTLSRARDRQVAGARRSRQLLQNVGSPTATVDGTRVELAANIEAVAEVPAALDLGAESIGLFRTELVYVDRRDLPSEREQYEDAVAVLALLQGRMATFRTLDLGGDKLPLAVEVPAGANPSLGIRAIRFSLLRPDVFRAQLRALYRASAHGPLRIMFPLIAGVGEVEQALAVCASVRGELDREGVAYDAGVKLGAMLETPSALLTTDHLADRCAFFSVGTNDLIQYALAADRDNQDVGYLYQPTHPALLRLLRLAVDAAAEAGRPISICGDMAADPMMTWVLLGLGFRHFSMAARSIPRVKAVIDGTRLADAVQLVEDLAQLRSAEQTAERVAQTMRRHFPLEFDSVSLASPSLPVRRRRSARGAARAAPGRGG